MTENESNLSGLLLLEKLTTKLLLLRAADLSPSAWSMLNSILEQDIQQLREYLVNDKGNNNA